jgi:hypothetical protein
MRARTPFLTVYPLARLGTTCQASGKEVEVIPRGWKIRRARKSAWRSPDIRAITMPRRK